MDKLNTFYNGGEPFVLNDLRFLQSALSQGIQGLASFFQNGGDPVAISGVEGTVVGTDVVYTQGFIVVNNEVYYVNGGVLPQSAPYHGIEIAETFNTEGNKTYENGDVHDTFIVRQGVLTTTATGSSIDITNIFPAKSALAYNGALVDISTQWYEVGQPGAAAFGTNWTNFSPGTPSSRVKYRRNSIGELEVKGIAYNPSCIITERTIFTLPSGFIPLTASGHICSGDDGAGAFFNQVNINLSGAVQVFGTMGVPKVVYMNAIKMARD